MSTPQLFFYCKACPKADQCNGPSWKKAACWDYDEAACRLKIRDHLIKSGKHNMDLEEATTLSNEAELAQGTYIIGGLTIQTATPVYLDGTATAGVHDGLLSFAIGVPALTAILQAFGQGALAPVVANLADVDTDGDSIADALSVAFRVEGVPCVVTW